MTKVQTIETRGWVKIAEIFGFVCRILGTRKDTKVTTDFTDLHRKTATIKIRAKIGVEKSRGILKILPKNFRV
jgi:hypothetical protein